MRISLFGLAFVGVANAFPLLRPALWRWWYDQVASKDGSGQCLLMNYGYDGAAALPLPPEDEPYRYPLQLYAHVVGGITLGGKDVLEVGCGRGGGASFLIRAHQPRSYTGVDLSEAAIAWCRRRFGVPGTEWLRGRADDLPVPDASMDVVVNVESSHCYPSMAGFVAEVRRALRPGGYFAFCDLRASGNVSALDRIFDASGLERIEREVINAAVVRALDRVSAQREQQIRAHVPRPLQRVFRDFVGMNGTTLHRMLADGQMTYLRYLLRKPAAAT